MKTSKILISISLCLFISITTSTKVSAQDLKGSWTLIKYKYGEDQELAEVPKVMNYVKHVTDRYFGWASYGENGNLIAAGGGTYTLTDSDYTESINYFHPHGFNLAGTSVRFSYKREGNDWTIVGYTRNVQLNPGSGEYETIDSVRLEEVWRKL